MLLQVPEIVFTAGLLAAGGALAATLRGYDAAIAELRWRMRLLRAEDATLAAAGSARVLAPVRAASVAAASRSPWARPAALLAAA